MKHLSIEVLRRRAENQDPRLSNEELRHLNSCLDCLETFRRLVRDVMRDTPAGDQSNRSNNPDV
jgi:hypothetical protein